MNKIFNSKFSKSYIQGFKRFFSTLEHRDVVVIGGGPGGYIAAIKAAQLGLKTTCIESKGLGGTCTLVGCIPSKALLNASHKYEEARKSFPEFGIKVGPVELDLETMMKMKEKKVEGLSKGVEGLFKKYNVQYVKGKGKIISPNEVSVKLSEGGEKIIPASNIIIATGSEVTTVPNIMIDEKLIVSSTGALSLQKVPNHLVVIGGGVIGLELGSVWRRLGAKVTVIEYTNRIAGGADGDVAKEFQRILEKQGISFQLERKVTKAVINQAGNSVHITTESARGGNIEEIDADVVLVSIGRRPYTEGLGLKEVGVKISPKGTIEVDGQFKTNIPSIRAIGDVIKGPMLAHKAEEEGVAVAEDILNPGVAHVNYNAIPSVIYTWPEVAWVGNTEEELKAKGVQYRVGKFPFKANSRARTISDTDGFVKMIADAQSDKLLGAHIIGAGAGDLISETVIAMEYGASSEDIARTSHAHPTLSEAVKEAAWSTFSKPLNF